MVEVNYLYESKKFSEAEGMLPQIDWASKSALMSSFCLYSMNFYDDAILNLKRFTKTYPADANIDYANYLIAISYYEKIIVENPSAENYFKLAVAAARKSLEVSRFFSITYVLKAKKSVLYAHRLAPKNPRYLKLLIKLFFLLAVITICYETYAKAQATLTFEKAIRPLASGLTNSEGNTIVRDAFQFPTGLAFSNDGKKVFSSNLTSNDDHECILSLIHISEPTRLLSIG